MVVTATRDIDSALAAAQCVVRAHWRLVEFLKAGQTLAKIDAFVAATLKDLDCRSAFLGYSMQGHPPFPSHSCLSVNDCIVHGTHKMTNGRLEAGDVISIDIGVTHHKWIGDAAWTYAIESASEETLRLMHVGRESLRLGMAAIRPGRPLIDWARAVENYVEKQHKFHLVRGLGGHSYGKKLHGPPFVANALPANKAEWPDAWSVFKPGMLLALEPMLAVGTSEVRTVGKEWPIYTADGSLSVHYEADVLITEDGIRDLTEGIQELPDVVG